MSSTFPLSLSEEQPYATTRALVVADFDRDGHVDINTGTQAVLGDGAAGVSEVIPINLAVWDSPIALDTNTDGLDEFVWKGLGAGIFIVAGGAAFPEIENYIELSDEPADVVAGDFDNDGQQDLAIAYKTGPDNQPTTKLVWLRGLGDGSFDAESELPAIGDTVLVAGDLFEGPQDDLYAGGFWLRSDASAFSTVDITARGVTPNLGANLLVADLTCDQRLDLLGAEAPARGRPLRAYVSSEPGQYLPSAQIEPPSTAGEWVPWDAADLNNDGLADLLLILDVDDYQSFGAYVAYATGDGAFSAPEALGTPNPWFAVRAIDFNNDGALDVAGVTAASFGPPDSGIPTVFGGVEVLIQEP